MGYLEDDVVLQFYIDLKSDIKITLANWTHKAGSSNAHLGPSFYSYLDEFSDLYTKGLVEFEKPWNTRDVVKALDAAKIVIFPL